MSNQSNHESPMTHYISGQNLYAPFKDGLEIIYLGLGCFWGAERLFWQMDGVEVTSVGYGGGITPNATYAEVCTGQTQHAELVMVVYDPTRISLQQILKQFWEAHDPTQGMRQGNDIGTQYRSVIFTTTDAQLTIAQDSRDDYQYALSGRGLGRITTEIAPFSNYYYAETEHQQYLAKNPSGYCGLAGIGITCPI